MPKNRSTDGWPIRSHIGIEPVRFGMTRDEAQRAIGCNGIDWGEFESFTLGQDTVEVCYPRESSSGANANAGCELIVVRGGTGVGVTRIRRRRSERSGRNSGAG